MAEAYKAFLGELKASDKLTFLKSQRAWIAATPGACSLNIPQATADTLNCLRKRYRERMQSLDGCGDGADVRCVDTPEAP